MNKFNNPFIADSQADINIQKQAKLMIQTLKKLSKTSKQNPQKLQISDNSLGQFSQYDKISSLDQQLNLSFHKRSNPNQYKIQPRKIKNLSPFQNHQHQQLQSHQQSYGCRKITSYFGIKKIDVQIIKISDNPQQSKNLIISEQKSNQNSLQNNPQVKALQQRILQKKKSIQQLQCQINKIREKYQKLQQQISTKIQNQKHILINFISLRYQQKIYNQRYRQCNGGQQKKCQNNLGYINQKIQGLKNLYQKNLRKNSRKKSWNQQTNMLEVYGEQKQAYFNGWKVRLQNQKKQMQKESTKVIQLDEKKMAEQRYYPLPELFTDANGNGIIFQKTYFPLYERLGGEGICLGDIIEVRMLNLKKLRFENVSLLGYPKTMKIERRMELKLSLKQLFEKSLQLQDEYLNSILISNSIFTQISTLSQQYMVMGRIVWQNEFPTITLKHILKKYQTLSQSISRYIIKTVLRTILRIKKLINYDIIILPQNIIFNQKYDIKIQNWVVNQILKVSEYGDNLNKDGRYLYFPPQYKALLNNDDQNLANMNIWTVGVILYQMLYGRKPFQYSHQLIDYQVVGDQNSNFTSCMKYNFQIDHKLEILAKILLEIVYANHKIEYLSKKHLKHRFFKLKNDFFLYVGYGEGLYFMLELEKLSICLDIYHLQSSIIEMNFSIYQNVLRLLNNSIKQ